MTHIAFRVDASLDIGTGHVMRCLALADALRAEGASCAFVSRAHPGHLLELIRERGFDALALPAPASGGTARTPAEGDLPHSHWLGVDPATDAAETLAALRGRDPDWLVMDHYALDARWQARLRAACRKLMVIDDLADRPHDCDLLLDQNLNRRAADYAALVPAHCEVLIGPRYAPLRPDFAALRTYSLERRKDFALRRLLVSMGGVDRDDFTSRVLTALADSALPDGASVTVVMGPSAPWLQRVRELAPALPFPVEVLVGVRDMARLMADTDLAVGATGTTVWERCCLGLPTITMVLASNQRDSALALAQAGAVAMIAEGSDLGVELACEIGRMRQPQVLATLSAAAAAVTDGAGCPRITQRMNRD